MTTHPVSLASDPRAVTASRSRFARLMDRFRLDFDFDFSDAGANALEIKTELIEGFERRELPSA